MKNVIKLASNIDVYKPLLAIYKIDKKHNIWLTENDSCQSINLRVNEERTGDYREFVDTHEFKILPELIPIVFNLMSFAHGERLGGININRINPGNVVKEDVNENSEYYDRFYIVLFSSPGAAMSVGDDSVLMETSSCYWVNSLIEALITNNSASDLVYLSIDIKTRR